MAATPQTRPTDAPAHEPDVERGSFARAYSARDGSAGGEAGVDGAKMPPADVIALQEADRGTMRAGGRHVARALAEALGMNFVRAGTPTPRDAPPKPRRWWLDFEERIRLGEGGDTGVAILSRLPLADASRIELPWSECPWRPRLALSAAVPFAGRRLRLFNAHIDTHASVEGQLEQHRAVLARADEVSERD